MSSPLRNRRRRRDRRPDRSNDSTSSGSTRRSRPPSRSTNERRPHWRGGLRSRAVRRLRAAHREGDRLRLRGDPMSARPTGNGPMESHSMLPRPVRSRRGAYLASRALWKTALRCVRAPRAIRPRDPARLVRSRCASVQTRPNPTGVSPTVPGPRRPALLRRSANPLATLRRPPSRRTCRYRAQTSDRRDRCPVPIMPPRVPGGNASSSAIQPTDRP